ncbi:polysaccharide deacetylase family protein [Clostridiaceae bacterium HFYG-1003]|nr:polysaccharide deacetylase family protein [Clostridiaceae bacterium HFYG-1003]
MRKRAYQMTGLISLGLSAMILAGCNINLPTSRPAETQPGVTTGGSASTTAATKPGTKSSQTLPETSPVTTAIETQPTTVPVTIPATIPATKPATKPVTKPATKPATKPVTKPATKPATTTSTKTTTSGSTGAYADISNKRYEWSYGYPTSWVTDFSGHWNYSSGKLYLTMDLGYEMGYTNVILDTLRDKGVKVTFFVTTEYIKENPGKVRRMLDEGHKVGNHSTKHINMVKLAETSEDPLVENTEKWEAAYQEATGRTSHLYRAPEGVFSKRGMAILEDMGYDIIFWGAAYADYDENNQPSIETAKEKLYKFISSGDVVLLHPFKTNSELLPEFIDDMRGRGYDFSLVP